MKNKKLLKTKKDLKRLLRDTKYFENVKHYKDLWFKAHESAIVVSTKEESWYPRFHDNWGNPIWVEDHYPMQFDKGQPPAVYFLEKLSIHDPAHITSETVALCHPYVTYFDEDGERVVQWLPFKKSKMIRTLLGVIKEYDVLYISAVLVPDGFHKQDYYDSPYENPYSPVEEYEYMNL